MRRDLQPHLSYNLHPDLSHVHNHNWLASLHIYRALADEQSGFGSKWIVVLTAYEFALMPFMPLGSKKILDSILCWRPQNCDPACDISLSTLFAI
jgi:hypothetical protein